MAKHSKFPFLSRRFNAKTQGNRMKRLREGRREKREATVFQVKRNLISMGYCF